VKVKKIRELIKIVEESNIQELEVSWWWTKVRIAKTKTGSAEFVPLSSVHAPGASGEAASTQGNLLEMRSPIVGTFYRSPSPESPSYVDVGHTVKTGQKLCIIEAMKIMNEIESDYDGKIVEICVENAQPVEYNQVLFRISPE